MSENKRTVDDLGRVAIPKEIRERLDIQAGDEIHFEAFGIWGQGYIEMHPIRHHRTEIDELHDLCHKAFLLGYGKEKTE